METPERGAEAEINAVIHRYATAIDTKNWSLFESCFTDDAVTDYGEIGQWSNAKDITAFMTTVHAGMRDTKHMLHNVVIGVKAQDRATATTYVHTVQVPEADPTAWIDAVGQYYDNLVLCADGWRIAERRFTMTRTLTSYQLINH